MESGKASTKPTESPSLQQRSSKEKSPGHGESQPKSLDEILRASKLPVSTTSAEFKKAFGDLIDKAKAEREAKGA